MRTSTKTHVYVHCGGKHWQFSMDVRTESCVLIVFKRQYKRRKKGTTIPIAECSFRAVCMFILEHVVDIFIDYRVTLVVLCLCHSNEFQIVVEGRIEVEPKKNGCCDIFIYFPNLLWPNWIKHVKLINGLLCHMRIFVFVVCVCVFYRRCGTAQNSLLSVLALRWGETFSKWFTAFRSCWLYGSLFGSYLLQKVTSFKGAI